VLITQYWSVPERWFNGAKVVAPGLSKPHRADFLYSASGVAMEGDGIGLDGKHVHWEYGGSWLGKAQGLGGWPPYWLSEGFWWTKAPAGKRKITYRLENGGWSNGKGAIPVPPRRVRFGDGPSRYLKAWGSIAVDPRVIPFGSAVKFLTDAIGSARRTPAAPSRAATSMGIARLRPHVPAGTRSTTAPSTSCRLQLRRKRFASGSVSTKARSW
jgi:hypothetical protein